MFSVGRFARLAGVSPKLLRAYDGLGLFRPVWVDPASSYRYYSPAQLPELRRILGLRDMGLGLADIGRVVHGGGDLRGALEQRRRELEDERRQIERRLRALEIDVDVSSADPNRPDVVVRPIPGAAVATRAVDDDEDEGAAFYELEAHVRDLHRRAHGPPGALVPRDDRDGMANVDGVSGIEIFVPVRGAIAPSGRIGFRRLPATRAATAIQRGDYDRVAGARGMLERWAAEAGLRQTGPLRILYLQFGAEPELAVPRGYVVERAADFLTELQLPIA
jgi:DNA-binding transcriptional MerR regulator